MKTQKILLAVLGLALSLPGLAKDQFDDSDLTGNIARTYGSPSIEDSANSAYIFTPIDVSGSTSTEANGNSKNAISGDFDDVGGNTHGFVLHNHIFTQIDVPVPNTTYTSVNGINESGWITGTYNDGNRLYAYIWSKKGFTTLNPFGSIQSQAGFLNDRGDVVGGYRDATNKRHAFFWHSGRFITIDPPNGHATLGPLALGINNHGEIVGTFVDVDGNRHGFLRKNGTYTTLDVPGAAFTVAEGINDADKIVGVSVDADGHEHGFVLSEGAYTIIDVPLSLSTRVYSINAEGEIVGPYIDIDGKTHGFIGTPIDH